MVYKLSAANCTVSAKPLICSCISPFRNAKCLSNIRLRAQQPPSNVYLFKSTANCSISVVFSFTCSTARCIIRNYCHLFSTARNGLHRHCDRIGAQRRQSSARLLYHLARHATIRRVLRWPAEHHIIVRLRGGWRHYNYVQEKANRCVTCSFSTQR